VEGEVIDADVEIDDHKDDKITSILVIIGVLLIIFAFFKYLFWFNWWIPIGFGFSVFPTILLIFGILLIVLGIRS
jgi:uncharacterized membrane protein YidH (DUF202 family)